MKIYRNYVNAEFEVNTLFPDKVRVSLTICPCWSKDDDPHYVERMLDELSGFVYLMVCDETDSDIQVSAERSYIEFVRHITHITGSRLILDTAIFNASELRSGKAIMNVFANNFKHSDHLSEYALLWARMLMDYSLLDEKYLI